MSNSKIKIALAGSTERTVICADAIISDERFEVPWVLTPSPRIVGRKKKLTQNPLHKWAQEHKIATTLVEKKINEEVKNSVMVAGNTDFLLVVDFGYMIPQWLLELPKIAPLNIHPSLLPRWRGSSPGQFVLLYGEKESAVTLMVMNEGLDSGPIITQLPFTVQENWTQLEYYLYSFGLIKEKLADLLADFAEGELTATPQPTNSPTPVARRLTREDGFIEWSALHDALQGKETSHLNPLLAEALSAHPNSINLIHAAQLALSPWPGLWTLVNNQRMKILSCHVEHGSLVLDQVQLEGKQPASWSQVQTSIV